MTARHPIKYRWTGRVMEPLVPSVAARQFTPGETCRLMVFEERSPASHRHYFAAIKEVWENLPESDAARFPTAEHLRKYALIRTGYRTERVIVADSNQAALQVAAAFKALDEAVFSIATVRDTTVTIYSPRSQGVQDMGKAEFQRSKDDVLDFLSRMIGVDRQSLDANAGRAA